MKESFSPVREESPVKEKSSIEGKLLERFRKCHEFLKGTKRDLKVGATVLLSMGAFEVAQAQDLSHFNKSIEDVQSGKLKMENVVNNFYNDFKDKKIDSTFSYFEYDFSAEDNIAEKDNNKMSLSGLSLGTDGDTIKLGTVQAIDYFVLMTKNKNENEDSEFSQCGKYLSGVKTGIDNEGEEGEDKTTTSYGATAEEAFIKAIGEASSLKQSEISEVHESATGVDSNKTETNNYILNTQESNNILGDVRVVISKAEGVDSNYFKAEVFYK